MICPMQVRGSPSSTESFAMLSCRPAPLYRSAAATCRDRQHVADEQVALEDRAAVLGKGRAGDGEVRLQLVQQRIRLMREAAQCRYDEHFHLALVAGLFELRKTIQHTFKINATRRLDVVDAAQDVLLYR